MYSLLFNVNDSVADLWISVVGFNISAIRSTPVLIRDADVGVAVYFVCTSKNGNVCCVCSTDQS